MTMANKIITCQSRNISEENAKSLLIFQSDLSEAGDDDRDFSRIEEWKNSISYKLLSHSTKIALQTAGVVGNAKRDAKKAAEADSKQVS